MTDESYDVLVIGSGAGGGPLALALAQAGARVLVLEKGPRYHRHAYRHDEIGVSAESGFFVPTVDRDPHVLIDRDHPDPAPVRSDLGWIASCVGGGTAHMSGYFLRLHPDDFRLRQRLGRFEAVADWPYGYDDLEPYYVRAEHEVGVAGPQAGHPYEGRRSRPLPMAPVRCHPLAADLERAAERYGWSAFPTLRAVASRPYGGRPACAYCESCGGFGCPVGARGSSQEALLPRAEQTGRCTVRPDAMVRIIRTDSAGRAAGCVYLDAAGEEHAVRARVVCVCCSAVESARLLLLSSSPRYPNGLANSNGLVGRNLQFHAGSTARARFRFDRHPDKSLEDPTPFLGRSIMDHYFLPEHVSTWPKGGYMRFGMSSPAPIAVAHQLAYEDGGPAIWGARLQRRLREYYSRYREIHVEIFHDFVPNDETSVSLDPEVTDGWGLPVARIDLRRSEHHRLAGRWLVDRALELFEAMGADEVRTSTVGGTSRVLVHGTCRAGHDPETSVLDAECRSHEVPNLYVVDGSFMPTTGGAPPTLTILANSFRVADRLVRRARRGEL